MEKIEIKFLKVIIMMMAIVVMQPCTIMMYQPEYPKKFRGDL